MTFPLAIAISDILIALQLSFQCLLQFVSTILVKYLYLYEKGLLYISHLDGDIAYENLADGPLKILIF